MDLITNDNACVSLTYSKKMHNEFNFLLTMYKLFSFLRLSKIVIWAVLCKNIFLNIFLASQLESVVGTMYQTYTEPKPKIKAITIWKTTLFLLFITDLYSKFLFYSMERIDKVKTLNKLTYITVFNFNRKFKPFTTNVMTKRQLRLITYLKTVYYITTYNSCKHILWTNKTELQM